MIIFASSDFCHWRALTFCGSARSPTHVSTSAVEAPSVGFSLLPFQLALANLMMFVAVLWIGWLRPGRDILPLPSGPAARLLVRRLKSWVPMNQSRERYRTSLNGPTTQI